MVGNKIQRNDVTTPIDNRTGEPTMPIILWLLGVPLTLVILLVVLGVV
jgi:hypothetical protein